MTKKDILELKRRMKKEECTFTKMCGCYVNSQKEILLTFNDTFLNLKEDEFYKYLGIASKALSGTIGNNLLNLPFLPEETGAGSKQQFLLGLRDSKLKNEELLQRFYEQVIDTYDYYGNFLILIFHDAYDVIVKTSDNLKLDESEEVYEYLLCAICPVSLSKPGLGYLENENRIGPRIRDWVVEAPDSGFVFPAFTDRSSDVNNLLFYTKNPKEPDTRFMEFGLGCVSKLTAAEQKATFHSIVKNVLMEENEENRDEIMMEIQQNLNEMLDAYETVHDEPSSSVVLDEEVIKSVMEETGVSEKITTKIAQTCAEEFKDTPPVAENVIDGKAVAIAAQQKKEKKLMKEVEMLKQQLSVSAGSEESNLDDGAPIAKPDCDIVLHVKPEKISEITSTTIEGQKFIMIPLDEDETALVNGRNAEEILFEN